MDGSNPEPASPEVVGKKSIVGVIEILEGVISEIVAEADGTSLAVIDVAAKNPVLNPGIMDIVSKPDPKSTSEEDGKELSSEKLGRAEAALCSVEVEKKKLAGAGVIDGVINRIDGAVELTATVAVTSI